MKEEAVFFCQTPLRAHQYLYPSISLNPKCAACRHIVIDLNSLSTKEEAFEKVNLKITHKKLFLCCKIQHFNIKNLFPRIVIKRTSRFFCHCCCTCKAYVSFVFSLLSTAAWETISLIFFQCDVCKASFEFSFRHEISNYNFFLLLHSPKSHIFSQNSARVKKEVSGILFIVEYSDYIRFPLQDTWACLLLLSHFQLSPFSADIKENREYCFASRGADWLTVHIRTDISTRVKMERYKGFIWRITSLRP